jgi:hypothetical protein
MIRLTALLLSIILISIPFVQAQELGETVYTMLQDTSKIISVLVIDFVYSLRLGFLKLKEHFTGDQTDKIAETRAYWQWELDNLRTGGKCCKSADCIVNDNNVCTSVCNDCNKVKNDLNNIFKAK